MSPWFETAGVVLVALSGVLVGKVFSRLPRSYWSLGYFFPCALVFILLVARCSNSLSFTPPLSWMLAGRVRFVLLCLAATIGLTTPLSRLPRTSEKIIICILMSIVVFWFSILPFLVPWLIRNDLNAIKTKIDANGVCYQSTAYTCAPAAAVTALLRLGLPAQEGELAILAHTSPVAGTLPTCLKQALETRYGSFGLRCHYRPFTSVSQLNNEGITLAVVRDSLMTDHCVAVLDVSGETVTLADPVMGKTLISRHEFEKIWRFTGIVLRRDNTRSI